MRVLITGGAGFIGSHLADYYWNNGDEVWVIDNLSTGSLDNINHLRGKERFELAIENVLNTDKLLEYIGTVDVVFHMAAAVGVQYILDNPLSSIETNIQGTENVLKYCNKFRKKVVLASSSEVYGKSDRQPYSETDDVTYGNSTTWRWSYAAAKLIDEFMGIAYHRNKHLPVTIVRLFNTVGPRQTGRYGMVIPRFVEQALQNKPITVYGDGNQSRTFTYVTDVVKCLVKLIDLPESEGEVFNLGGCEEITIVQLAHKIRDLVSSKSEIRLIPYNEAMGPDFEDMTRRVPDMTKLNKLLGFVPTTSIDEILNNVIEYMKTTS